MKFTFTFTFSERKTTGNNQTNPCNLPVFALMLGMNWYQVVELYKLVTTKMLSKLKKPKTEEE